MAPQNSLIWLFLLLLLVLSACTQKPDFRPAMEVGNSAGPAAKELPARSAGSIALDTARSMLGIGYRYGGNNPRGFDCSGLVQYSFRQAGVALPRTSQDIFEMSQRVKPAMIQPGDLVFFRISSKKISHVGIYAGNRRFIHAPSSGKGVSYANLDHEYWNRRLVGFGRI